MCTFMAGTSTTGPGVANSNVDTASSAKPQAALARRFAVQGHTTTRSAHSPHATWPMAEGSKAKRSLSTGVPVSPSNVAGPTNRWAFWVRATRTSQPAFCSPRSTSAALYAAMQPLTHRTTRGARVSGAMVSANR